MPLVFTGDVTADANQMVANSNGLSYLFQLLSFLKVAE
jgi:hypothetical protein